MKRTKKILAIKIVAAAAFVIGGCMNADMPPEMFNADAESVSVVTAVQLGAEPGCLGINYRISGNITVMKVEEDHEMALVLQDGDPLCVDTMDLIKEEMDSLEGNLKELLVEEIPLAELMDDGEMEGDIGDVMREGWGDEADGMKHTSDSSGDNSGSDGKGGGPKVDPNPQPALESGLETGVGGDGVTSFTETPPTNSGNQTNPGSDNPPAPPR
ncbi:MAG: hypothetical protein ABIJ56_08090 [Pseudomonadota bacterium]